ncbi:MAG: sensor histidine kinase [Trueperaceae bacterium]|nr:sensor histidine kinase [Trueperaceae bacterium]
MFSYRPRWWRRLNLAQKFNLICLLVLFLCLLVSGWWLARAIERGVINRTAAATALYVENFIIQQIQELSANEWLSQERIAEIERLLATTPLGEEIVDIKIWRTDGRVVYGENAGEQFPVKDELQEAIEGQVVAHISRLTDEENADKKARWGRLIEIYSPMRIEGSARVIAVAEFYQTVDALEREIFSSQWRSWLLMTALFAGMYVLLVGMVRRGSDTIERQRLALEKQVDDLNSLLTQNSELSERVRRAVTRNTAVNERFLRRIGSELHDGPAQDVSLSLLRLDRLGSTVKENQIFDDELEIVQGSLSHALAEMRSIAAGLRLPELQNLSLKEVVDRVIKQHQKKTNTLVGLDLGGLPEQVSLSVKITLYRIIQEALNNAFMHAGGKGQKLKLKKQSGNLQVEISDQGPGFDARKLEHGSERLGLVGMRERVESLGGEFAIDSDDSGTRVYVSIPLKSGTEQKTGQSEADISSF